MFRFLLLISSAFATIQETNQIEDILTHVDESTWVLFDLDDTLIESKNQFARSQWFGRTLETFIQNGKGKADYDRELYPLWIEIQSTLPIQTPEEESAHIVRKAQSATRVMGLTARHLPVISTTHDQLEKLNIDLSRNCPVSPLVELELPHPVLYEKGILFVSDFNRKGAAMRAFLEQSETKPKKIVFVDDTRHHLENMEEELLGSGIEFVGFHYTRTHEKPYDHSLAEIQHSFYPKIISDEEALKIRDNRLPSSSSE